MLLNHVLSNLKIPPGNIIFTGDSAGAHLALSLLSHISHPHPSTTVPIPSVNLSSPLLGAVLISPWISFDLSTDSFKRNAWKDCIAVESEKQWSSAFLSCPWPHEEVSDEYNQAITADSSWWKDLKVEQILVTAGEEEVLVDGIREFVEKFSKFCSFPFFSLILLFGQFEERGEEKRERGEGKGRSRLIYHRERIWG